MSGPPKDSPKENTKVGPAKCKRETVPSTVRGEATSDGAEKRLYRCAQKLKHVKVVIQMPRGIGAMICFEPALCCCRRWLRLVESEGYSLDVLQTGRSLPLLKHLRERQKV
jgi:hypothetical protein